MVNRRAILISPPRDVARGKGVKQQITLESLDGSERADGSRRMPKLCVCCVQTDRDGSITETSVMLTHNELLKIIWFYRHNDRIHWPRLMDKILDAMTSETDVCPSLNGGGCT